MRTLATGYPPVLCLCRPAAGRICTGAALSLCRCSCFRNGSRRPGPEPSLLLNLVAAQLAVLVLRAGMPPAPPWVSQALADASVAGWMM